MKRVTVRAIVGAFLGSEVCESEISDFVHHLKTLNG